MNGNLFQRSVVDWKVKNRAKAQRDSESSLEQRERAHVHYQQALHRLNDRGIPYLLGGAYAFMEYTGIERYTKDLDLFIKPADCETLLEVLADEGFDTEITFRHWLGKALKDEETVIDIIFGSGNGICLVDDVWFERSVPYRFLDLSVRLIPREEMIWSKGFILERNRFDGADIAHLLRAQSPTLDWDHLLWRFGAHWRLLLSHLILFGFIYPEEKARIPSRVMRELLGRLLTEDEAESDGAKRLCRGTLLSHGQFRKDIESWGYEDARLEPWGNMSREDVEQWMAAFE